MTDDEDATVKEKAATETKEGERETPVKVRRVGAAGSVRMNQQVIDLLTPVPSAPTAVSMAVVRHDPVIRKYLQKGEHNVGNLEYGRDDEDGTPESAAVRPNVGQVHGVHSGPTGSSVSNFYITHNHHHTSITNNVQYVSVGGGRGRGGGRGQTAAGGTGTGDYNGRCDHAALPRKVAGPNAMRPGDEFMWCPRCRRPYYV